MSKKKRIVKYDIERMQLCNKLAVMIGEIHDGIGDMSNNHVRARLSTIIFQINLGRQVAKITRE